MVTGRTRFGQALLPGRGVDNSYRCPKTGRVSAPVGKQHREFFALPLSGYALPEVGWQVVPGTAGLIDELILADNIDADSRTGSRTRLTRWAAGMLLPQPVRHDYREEILIVSGDLVVGCDPDGQGGEAFTPLSFATRPAGIWHGPFTTRTG